MLTLIFFDVLNVKMSGWVWVYVPCEDISEHQDAFAKEVRRKPNWERLGKFF